MKKIITTIVEVLETPVIDKSVQYQISAIGDVDENGIVSNYEMISVDLVYDSQFKL